MYQVARTPIKMWAEDDRPREKLMLKGRNALSDAELIAIILGSGTREESAVELARRILSSVNNDLDEVGKLSCSALCEFKGIGEARALNIIAALELGRRRSITMKELLPQIKSSNDGWQAIRKELEQLEYEEFWILMLNRANKVIRKEKISQGGMNATIVDPRVLFKTVMENGANSIILCHNHPSGEVRPSENDIRLTRKLKEGALILDISLLDHLIVGANTYFSFADEGLL